MPELPDITVYLEALEQRLIGQRLERIALINPFLLRTATPPLKSAEGRRVEQLRRMGKRVAIGLTGDLWLVLHLMIAGRLHWFARGSKLSGRAALARFEFENGTLTLTEAGSKRRASLHLVSGTQELLRLDPGVDWKCWTPTCRHSPRGCDSRITRSSARSPIRTCSAESATPTPTRSCIGRGCRRWHCRRG